jgi:hypothetical protein
MADQNQAPAFDPNASYQAVQTVQPVQSTQPVQQTPAFNPNADYSPAPKPDTGVLSSLKRNTVGVVQGIFHALTDPATEQEKQEILDKIREQNQQGDKIPEDLATNPSRATLALHRLIDAPADELEKKSKDEIGVAQDLLNHHQYWKGGNLYLSGLADRVLSAVPLAGPAIGGITERGEGSLIPAIDAKGNRIRVADVPADRKDFSGAATDIGSLLALENAPKIIGGGKSTATHIFNPETGAISPIESATSKIAGKSGIAEGATAPTSEAVQAPIQNGIRSVVSDFAKEQGVGGSASSAKSIRSVVEDAADAVYGKSKQAYQTLDDASGGRWQRFDDSIKNISDKMDEVAGVDDEKFDELAAKKTGIETAQQKMIDQLVSDGKIDPKLADKAKADYKTSQALYDLDKQIKASTTGRAGIGNGVETVNPKGLSTRLNKLYDSGRLQQAVGDDRAAQLLTHADTAQTLSELPSTGQKALQELLAGSTKQGRVFGTNTSFFDALGKFDQMAPEVRAAQFGKDAGTVRQFLKTQARNQFIKTVIKHAAVGVGAVELGKELGINKALLHALL